jgi:glyoxylase I family protein
MTEAPPPTTGFDHFSPTVADAEVSAAWYAEVFGLERIPGVVPHHGDEAGGHAILLVDPRTRALIGVHQHVGFVDGRFDERRAGLDHLAWGVTTRAQLAEWVRWLDQLGVRHSGITDIRGDRSYSVVVFRDPDGIQLELIARGG